MNINGDIMSVFGIIYIFLFAIKLFFQFFVFLKKKIKSLQSKKRLDNLSAFTYNPINTDADSDMFYHDDINVPINQNQYNDYGAINNGTNTNNLITPNATIQNFYSDSDTTDNASINDVIPHKNVLRNDEINNDDTYIDIDTFSTLGNNDNSFEIVTDETNTNRTNTNRTNINETNINETNSNETNSNETNSKKDEHNYKSIEFDTFYYILCCHNIVTNFIPQTRHLISDKTTFDILLILLLYTISLCLNIKKSFVNRDKIYLKKGLLQNEKFAPIFMLSLLVPFFLTNLFSDMFTIFLSENLVLLMSFTTCLLCVTAVFYLAMFATYIKYLKSGRKELLWTYLKMMLLRISLVIAHLAVLVFRVLKMAGPMVDKEIEDAFYVEEQIFVILYLFLMNGLELFGIECENKY